MGKVTDTIDTATSDWIARQGIYFVATAPTGPGGHVNCSPKGLDTFRVLSPTQVAYLDLTGSGNETAAHLGDNGRITLMFCAFEGPPRILRLYGHGRVVLPSDADWSEVAAGFPELAGTRQLIVADIDRVQNSCGSGVPLFEPIGERDALLRWAETKGPEGLAAYRRENNARSLDGLPTAFANDDPQI